MATPNQNIEQWVKEVCDFSSQYGNETSISYTVPNITGPPTLYPSYGDFTSVAVLRTYGPWWLEAPSAPQPFQRTPPSFISHDFMDLGFEIPVYPSAICVYETYNPGAIVKILAADVDIYNYQKDKFVDWFVLWSNPDPWTQVKRETRIFRPSLNPCEFKTNLIRLEFNSTVVDYYTELDAVKLIGEKCLSSESIADPVGTDVDTGIDENGKCCFCFVCGHEKKSSNIGAKYEVATSDSQFHSAETGDCLCHVSPEATEPVASGGDRITQDLAKLHLNDEGLSAVLKFSDNGIFDSLPEEVIQLIISYLDIPSLCTLSRVCHLMHKHSYDPLQYTELNLQPHWTQVTDTSLDSLKYRCRHLQRLNLSWCGNYNNITYAGFTSYMSTVGSELTSLLLANCNFVNSDALIHITNTCPNLQVLDLASNRQIDIVGFAHLCKLKKLQWLSLYRTLINTACLVNTIRGCPDLMHLNLGSCASVRDLNDVAFALAENCKSLRSLDVWRGRSLSEDGVRSIADSCHLLEEIDLGWCSELRNANGSLSFLPKKCKNLKKYFLTANRSVNDEDLRAVADHCPLMEQLDILGCREVTPAGITRVLEQCRHLKFFDVSFCSQIDFATVNEWKKSYPQVAFKKSFQTAR